MLGYPTSAAARATADARAWRALQVRGRLPDPMVVVTEYEFDAATWRAAAGHGPEVIAVDVGTGGCDWSKLPLAPGALELRSSGAAGITRVVFEGDGESFSPGGVEFEFSSAA